MSDTTMSAAGFRHGTRYGYTRKACRCGACRGWYNAWFREYRRRRMAERGERMVKGKFVPA